MLTNMSPIPGIAPTNVSHGAALVVLGTALVLALSGLAFVGSLVKRRRVWAIASAATGLGTAATYGLTLLALSLSSRDQTLPRGEEKYFCELDCHLAYSIAAVRTAPTLGDATGSLHAAGRFVIVTVRTRFDETTIAPWRPRDTPLWPNPRIVTLVDGAGRVRLPSAAGQRLLERTGESGTPLSRELRPGESYRSTLVFDVPRDAGDLRLLVQDPGTLLRFVIADENSMFHKKTFLRL